MAPPIAPSAAVLMVSKPIVPPWDDSSKNLVKDLALSGSRYRYHVMTPRDFQIDARVVSEPVYAASGDFTPPLRQNARVVARLLRRDSTALCHFFFAPNLKSVLAARLALALRPRRTIQTVCSTPKTFNKAGSLLFAPHVIVLSHHARRAFENAGVAAARLSVIPPGIHLPPPPSDAQRIEVRRQHHLPVDAPLLIYPGDYQFSQAAHTVARAFVALRDTRATLIMACRIKQRQSRSEEARIRRLLRQAGVANRVRFYNHVPDIVRLVGACDLCLLPAESLFAKMDLPLVLIEAMAQGVPILVADKPPLCEILAGPGGVAVPAQAEAVAAEINQLLRAPDALKQLGARARKTAAEKFDIRHVSAQYEALYDDVLQTKPIQARPRVT